MDRVNYIYTKDSHCLGCNKCIFKCPVNANKAIFDNNENNVIIKEGFCISCGECGSICDHNARDYYDDLDIFFEDLQKGIPISVVVAPAVLSNFEHKEHLFGYLKSIGVNQIYDVSLGADICTWAHVKKIREKAFSSIIAQPCPVVVSFVEKFHPELIPRLSPVQSPVVCLGIYLKKYLGITDRLMFLSPCIGKKRECTSIHTHGVLDYNVTFAKFIDYISTQMINLLEFPSTPFDNMKGSHGFTFPRPGGLTENIQYHLEENIWTKRIEGIFNINQYFTEYLDDIKSDRPVPLIIDALNCIHGCNLGTGTLRNSKHNHIDHTMNENIKLLSKEESDILMNKFDHTFNIDDFLRSYTDRSIEYKTPDEIDLEKIFLQLGKFTEQDRKINCFSCGYGNCTDFAYSMAIGDNHKNNCKHYLLNKFKKISLFDDLTGVKNRYSYKLALERLQKNHPLFVGIIFIDINGLKEANDQLGHVYGDQLIIRCSDMLKRFFLDKIYRIGGDEFIVLDNKSDPATFRKKLTEMQEELKTEKNLMVSMGSSYSVSPDQLDQKIEEADLAMYAAKKAYYRQTGKANRRL